MILLKLYNEYRKRQTFRHVRERICRIVFIARNLSALEITNLFHYYALRVNQQFLIFRDVTVAFTLHACSFYMHHTSATVAKIRTILVSFHAILYCYDIPRYIATLAILVSSHSYRR